MDELKRLKALEIPVSVVIRRRPGPNRWAKWSYRPVAVMPDAPAGDWRTLRDDGEVTDYLIGPALIHLYRTDVEGYQVALGMAQPTLFVVMRKDPDHPHGLRLHLVTASAYEAQDHTDADEDIVEPLPMPPEIAELVEDYCDAHHHDTPFIKRKRDKKRVDLSEDGIGDARIRQTADVYRAPGAQKPKVGS